MYSLAVSGGAAAYFFVARVQGGIPVGISDLGGDDARDGGHESLRAPEATSREPYLLHGWSFPDMRIKGFGACGTRPVPDDTVPVYRIPRYPPAGNPHIPTRRNRNEGRRPIWPCALLRRTRRCVCRGGNRHPPCIRGYREVSRISSPQQYRGAPPSACASPRAASSPGPPPTVVRPHWRTHVRGCRPLPLPYVQVCPSRHKGTRMPQ